MPRTKPLLSLTLLLAVLAVPLLCQAQDMKPGARDHSGGFFLRLAVGGGYAESKNSGVALNNFPFTNYGLEFSGGSAELDIAIGAIVAENLAVHGTIFGWVISDPYVKAGSLSQGSSGDADMTALGAGLTYYFMPVNIYLSGSVGVGTFSASGDVKGESDSGFASQLTAGKEWWVSDRWGLGAAVLFGYASISESTSSKNWNAWNIAAMFSATFN